VSIGTEHIDASPRDSLSSLSTSTQRERKRSHLMQYSNKIIHREKGQWVTCMGSAFRKLYSARAGCFNTNVLSLQDIISDWCWALSLSLAPSCTLLRCANPLGMRILVSQAHSRRINCEFMYCCSALACLLSQGQGSGEYSEEGQSV
jgi:hypothetical protein